MKEDINKLLEIAGLFSENVSKNVKRGRPRIPLGDFPSGSYLYGKTIRTKQNHKYVNHALETLSGDQKRFAYLFCPTLRLTILTELGRMGNPQAIIKCSEFICEHKLKTKQALATLRDLRGKGKPDIRRLKRAIGKAINDYCQRYPTTTLQDINGAIWAILEDCDARMAASPRTTSESPQ